MLSRTCRASISDHEAPSGLAFLSTPGSSMPAASCYIFSLKLLIHQSQSSTQVTKPAHRLFIFRVILIRFPCRDDSITRPLIGVSHLAGFRLLLQLPPCGPADVPAQCGATIYPPPLPEGLPPCLLLVHSSSLCGLFHCMFSFCPACQTPSSSQDGQRSRMLTSAVFERAAPSSYWSLSSVPTSCTCG